MNVDTYRTLARRFLNEQASMINLHHAVLGMASEIAELRELYLDHRGIILRIPRESLLEELGDCYWFAALASSEAGGKSFSSWFDNLAEDVDVHHNAEVVTMRGCLDVLELASGDLLSLTKRVVGYGEPDYRWDRFRPAFRLYLFALRRLVAALAYEHEITEDEILEANIAKLSARYPGKEWSEQGALGERDKNSELAAIRG